MNTADDRMVEMIKAILDSELTSFDEMSLRGKLQQDPSNWEIRRRLAQTLFDKREFADAAETLWASGHIPATDLDLAFSARILAKAQPRKAIRLLTAALELNGGNALANLLLARALLQQGMVIQATRFYGAALDADPGLVSPDLEHFMIWIDDEHTMWGPFESRRPKLGELPWMLRDPKEALRLTSSVSVHSTPLYVPRMPGDPGGPLLHEAYQKEVNQGGETSPPSMPTPVPQVLPEHPDPVKKPRLLIPSAPPPTKRPTTSQG